MPPIHSSADPAAVETTCREHDLTGDEFRELHRRSVAAKSTAYCPYSRFRVGSSILSATATTANANTTGEGEGQGPVYFDGANVENASYPVGTCAERVAFGKAVTGGHRRVRAVAVATDIAPPASPCGMCRQFIREFCDPKTPIIMFDKDDQYVVLRLEEMLPMSFGPEALPPPGTLRAS